MSIVRITGPAKSGKTVIANALRNYYVNQQRGVLLIDAGNADAESRDLLGKIATEALPDKPAPAASIGWKLDPVIILVGDQAARLEDFEALAPGFAKRFGAEAFAVQTGAIAAQAGTGGAAGKAKTGGA